MPLCNSIRDFLHHTVMVLPVLAMVCLLAPASAEARAIRTGRHNVVQYRPVSRHPTRGNPAAPLRILYWADFMSYSTGRAQPVLEALLKRYRGKVVLQYMSRYRDGTRYAPARLAAAVAREAFVQGGNRLFWKLHDALAKRPNPYGLKAKDVKSAARTVGVRMSRLAKALASGRHDKAIAAERALSKRLGVSGYTYYVVLLVGRERYYVNRYTRLSHLDPVVRRNLKRARKYAGQGLSWAGVQSKLLADAKKLYRPYRRYRSKTRVVGRRRGRWHKIPIGRSPTVGPRSAVATVVAFLDFTNYQCAYAWSYLRSQQKLHKKRMRLVFKALPRPRYSRALNAARAAYAAHAQGRFWKTADVFFRNRYRLYGSYLARYVKQAGVDVSRFRRDMKTPSIARQVLQDIKLGRKVGATYRPTVFINGRRTSRRWNRYLFAARLKEALKGGLLTRLLDR